MLVLSRGNSESINVYFTKEDGTTERLKITVVDVNCKKARLGFEANESVVIWRDEIDPHLSE